MYRGFQSWAGTAVRLATAPRTLAAISMDVEFAQLSDLGKVRQGNEDYLGYLQPETPEEARSRGWLFVLADGVGGHDRGEVASRVAVETMLAGFRRARGEPHTSLLPGLAKAANARVLEAAHSPGSIGAPMATTLVACALRYDRAVVSHVGDSRCYLIRRNEGIALTRDHTVANEHVRLRIMSKEEAADADTRHFLSRSLGASMGVNVDTSEHQVFAGDVLVLCCDGLHGSVTASEIAAVAGNGGDLNNSARRLVDLANQRDGSDNISLQIVRVKSVERVGMYRGRPYRLP
jgi:PPM family protein phosphatase